LQAVFVFTALDKNLRLANDTTTQVLNALLRRVIETSDAKSIAETHTPTLKA